MKTFKELLAEDAIDYVVVQLPLNLVDVAALLNEGRWVPSTKNGWMERVEAENPAIKQMSHVHVARSKHINNKNMQASWNVDGTRHDKKTFNDKVGATRTASRGTVSDPDRGTGAPLGKLPYSAHVGRGRHAKRAP